VSHDNNQNGTPVATASPPHAALPPAPAAPIIVRATREEAAGAALKVGGLTIVERAVKQLARMPVPRVILATDGTVAIPARLPSKAEVRRLPAETQTTQSIDVAIETLRAEVGATSVVAGDVVRVKATDLASGGGLRVVDETTRAQAEDAIFNDLLRGDLGLVARHINKKISFRITRYVLCHLPFTPNQVTLGAAAIGLLGCLLIAAGTYPAMIAGLALAQLQSILDGCDGELARVRFQQTAIGEWLDTLVDDGLNLAIIASLAVGLARNGLGWLALAGGAAAFGMYLFYNVVSYRELIRQGQGGELIKIRWKLARGRDMKTMVGQGGASGGISGLVLSLGRRDTFVFGWLILAILHLLPLALVWALLTSLSCFVMAVGQVIVRDEPAP
jgi:phosphatidylglycerophosphate synthase